LSDEENRATKNKKSVYSILVDFHPQFLEAIKDVYPLGVLSSLSMTIAAFITAFGKESLILAQTYAIAASLMFLLAFSFSLVLKFFLALEKNTKGSSLGQYALFSYICTVSGIVFLFLAGVQFVYVLSIAKLLIPIFAILFIVFILFPVPSILNTAKQSKSKSISILGYLTITCFLLAVLSTISIILLIYGIVLPLPIMWGYLLIGSLFLSIPFLFALIILSYVQVHKRK
jgi:hypothetical protein